MVTAIDVAILVPDPVKSLAIKLSRQINPPDFCLNNTDILPHVTLGMGFIPEDQIPNTKYQISNIVKNFRPFEVTVERLEARYLVVRKSYEIEKLHRQITVQVDFVQPADFSGAYFKPGEEISEETKKYTANFKLKNSFGNYVPHITLGWDEEKGIKSIAAFGPHITSQTTEVDASVALRNIKSLPVSFTVDEIAICQLGEKNTCRKVLAQIPLGV